MFCDPEHHSACDKNADEERGMWHQTLEGGQVDLEVLQDNLHHGGCAGQVSTHQP